MKEFSSLIEVSLIKCRHMKMKNLKLFHADDDDETRRD